MKIPENLSLGYYEFILTDNCNYRCSYCFDNYFSSREKLSNTHHMNIDMMDDIFNFIEKTRDKDRSIHFSWFGGEPLMNFKFIKAFVERAKGEFNFDYDMSINTNGSLLNTEVIDFLSENKIAPSISLDGVSEAHDSNRVLFNNKGTWDKTVQHLPELAIKSKRFGFNVNALMVVNQKNYHLLSRNYKFLKKMGFITQILFDHEVSFEGDFKESILRQMEELFLKERIELPTFMSRKVLNKDYHCNSDSFCFHPDRSVSISPEGKLFFCHQMVPKMAKIDENFKDYYGDIYKGYDNEEYHKTLKSRIEFSSFQDIKEECKSCPAAHWCKGGCFSAHWYNKKDTFGLNKNICEMHKSFQKIAEKLI